MQTHTWSVGGMIEVAGDADEGFPASWATGVIKAFVADSTLLQLQYDEVCALTSVGMIHGVTYALLDDWCVSAQEAAERR